jgi:hypothetical protein
MLFFGKVCLGNMYSETTTKTILINIAAGCRANISASNFRNH